MTALPARLDLPVTDTESAPFWEAARRKVFLIRRCNSCGQPHFYPRPFCPTCWSGDLSWEEAHGTGTLYAYSTVYFTDLSPFNERLPYVAAIVELDEGPRLMSNVVECELSELAVGMPLEVTFRQETNTITLPLWRPRRGPESGVG
jgi:uncharacterized protein